MAQHRVPHAASITGAPEQSRFSNPNFRRNDESSLEKLNLTGHTRDLISGPMRCGPRSPAALSPLPLPPPCRRWAACVLPRRIATAAAHRSRTPVCLADASVIVSSSRVQSCTPLLPTLVVALRMPLLPLAWPRPSALPHCHWCAHPCASIAPGLLCVVCGAQSTSI